MDDDGYFIKQCKTCKLWKDCYEYSIPGCILCYSDDNNNCLNFELKTPLTNKEKK